MLTEVVGPFQHAFVPGRRASDCAMTLNLIMEKLKLKNKAGIILSLDMEKAYDRVHHGWLFKVLERLETGPTITRWIKALYSNVQSTCMVNGFHSDPVQTNRGVRQEDALSCALFILSMIPFILSIEKECRIKGVKCANDLRVPVLVYADDTTVILDPDSDLKALLDIFTTFNRASNAKINMTKSVLITIGGATAIEIGFHRLQAGEVMKVLGFPITQTGLQPAETFWRDKIEELNRTALNIHPEQLTLRGRILLLNSLMLSKASYYMDLIPIPKSKLTKLENIYFKTLWKGKNKSSVDRRVCQLPWDVGGIAAKNIELWSRCKAIMWVKSSTQNLTASGKKLLKGFLIIARFKTAQKDLVETHCSNTLSP